MIFSQASKLNIQYVRPGESKVLSHERVDLSELLKISDHSSGKRISLRIDLPPCIIQSVTISQVNEVPLQSRVLLNGYQSWTDTRWFSQNEQIKPMLKPALDQYTSYGDYLFFEHFQERSCLRSHSWLLIEQTQGVDLWGSLLDSNGFTVFLIDSGQLEIRRDLDGTKWEGGEYLIADFFYMNGEVQEVMRGYCEALGLRPFYKPASGYTSWYNLYNQISEQSILSDLAGFKDAGLPLQYFQIDDGYQESIGNWTQPNSKFPSGLRALSDQIHAAGYKSGLWLAPFLCEQGGWLEQEHPDYIMRDESGEPIQVGVNPGWSGPFYALDLFKPDVLEYLESVFKTILFEYGFDMLKLDFLFAACFHPRSGMNRGAQMRRAMELIRQWATSKKEILACGVPLISTAGLVDYCRIGADVEYRWETEDLKNCNYRERVSNENAVHNAVNRAPLNGYFFANDPDVFILRDTISSLNKEPHFLTNHQQMTLFLVNQVCGELLFTSDPVSSMRKDWLDIYRSSFPAFHKKILRVIAQETYQIDFEVQGRRYKLIVNLQDLKHSVFLADDLYFDRLAEKLLLGPQTIELEPYESKLFYIPSKEDIVLGSTYHIFSGAELDEISLNSDQLQVIRHKDAIASGRLWLRCKDSRLPVNVEHSGCISVDKGLDYFIV